MAAETQGRAIFISYRRDDTEGEAGRLYDDLVRAYGDDSVFMDVSGIQPGSDFRKAIEQNVGCCGVLLAMIGPEWATITGSDGARRLDNPTDYVRLEIATALARNVAVIPVLVHGAHMPPLEALPDDLKDLRYRNSVELTHARWNSDVALLVTALRSYVHVSKSQQTETVHATIPVQLPAPQAVQSSPKAKKSKAPLFAAIAVLLVLGIAAATYWLFQGDDTSASDPQPVVRENSAKVPSSPEDSAAKPASNPSSASKGSTAPEGEAIAMADFLGRWKNSKDVTVIDGLSDLTVANFGGQIMVHAWGHCQDHLCDWGTKPATVQGHALVTEAWELRNTAREQQDQRTASLSLTATDDGLQVTVHNTYVQPSGQTKENFTPLEFEKKP